MVKIKKIKLGGTTYDLCDADALHSHQTIKQDGVTGSTANRYGECSTAVSTAAKTVSITKGTFSLETGARVTVKFGSKNTANSPTLNVNGTGAKNIFHNGAQITSGTNKGMLYGTVDFVYDGTQWHLVGNYVDTDTNTHNSHKINSGTKADGSTSITSASASSEDITLGDSGVTAGTYRSVTVNSKGIVVAGSSTDTDTNTTYDLAASKSKTNGNVTIDLTAGGSGSGTDSVKIKGSGATTVTTDSSGVITISSTDNNTVYTHPSYTAKESGLYKITVDSTGHVSGATAVSKSDITGLGIPGSDTNTDRSSIAYCDTGASTAAKTATMPGFALATGQRIFLRTTVNNSATSSVTLNVNSTGAKSIKIGNSSTNPTASNFPAGDYIANYDGTYWILTRIYLTDNNTTYSSKDAASSGTDVSLVTTGEKYKWNAAKTHADSAHAPSDAEKNVQSDWSVTDTSSDAFIKNKPTIPTVNNATLTIQKNGTTVDTFTANSSTNKTVNITVPTGAAADKGVDTSISAASTSINLPTSAAVAAFVEGKGYKTTDNNTWRNININGTQLLGTSTSTGAVNFKSGTNVTVSGSGNDITISATDTNTHNSHKINSGKKSDNSTDIMSTDASSGNIILGDSGVTAGTYKRVTVNAKGIVVGGDNVDADTNTWRPIKVNGNEKLTDNSTALNLKAGSNVSLSYNSGTVTINSSYTDTNTSHTHTAGIGLVGDGSAGTSGGNYDYKANLRSETALTLDSTAVETTSGRVYPVAVDKSGYLAVNVPWTDTNTDTHYTKYLQINGNGTEAVKFTQNADKTLNLKPGSNVSISATSGEITISATDTNTWRPIGTGATDAAAGNHTHSYLPKVTYEWNKEFAAGQNGAISLGRYNVYDSQLTFDITSTTSQSLSGKLVIATQNGQIGQARVFGDATGTLASKLIIYQSAVTSSRSWIEVFCNFDGWSKNKVHIYAVALNSATVEKQMTSVTISSGTPATANVTSGDTKWSGTIVNDSAHSHDVSITTSSGTNELTLAHGTKYALTAGGQSFIFTMPGDNNTNTTYDLSAAKSKSNGSVTLDLTAGGSGSGTDSVTIKGTGATTVTTDANGVITINSTDTNTDTNSWRKVQLNGTDKLGTGTSTNPLNIKAGTNMTITESNGTFTFSATDTNTNTATAADNILDGSNSGTEITYKPYTAQQSKLSFDTSTTNPTRTDRLNLNGYLYGTKLYSGGKEVLTSHQDISGKQDKLTAQTAYTSKGSATKVPQITTNSLGQVTGITEVTITQPTVNNAKLTLNVGGAAVSGNDAFTANDSTDTTYNVPVATSSVFGVVKTSTGITNSSGTISVAYGTTSGTACQGNDSRLSDSRTPTSHTHGNITNSGTITSTTVTSATGVLVYDSNNKIQRATAAQTRAIIGAGTSNLTLGTTSTTAAKGDHTHTTNDAIYVDSSNKIHAAGFHASSDRRLKENIKEFVPQKSILDLPVVEFDFKATKNHTIGCIAQDLQEICPELVATNDSGFLSIEESKLTYLLLIELKKLKKETEDLKAEIDTLKNTK